MEASGGERNQTSPAAALWSVAGLLPAIAPLTVALTGMLYLAGWIYEYRLLFPFGLTRSAFEHSLQDVLALGFIPIFIGTLVLFLIITALGFVPAKWSARIFAFVLHRDNFFSRLNMILLGSTIILSYGFFSGGILGDVAARNIAIDVEGGCKEDCYLYVVDGRPVLGRMIMQDKDRIAVYTKAGTLILKSEQVTRVQPTGSVTEATVF